jgi:hypothetical protein
MFNEYFQSASVQDLSLSFQPDSSSPLSSISSIDLSAEEVYQALQNLGPSKAQGHDGFTLRILKECAFQVALSLYHLFTKLLRLSQVPAERKLANIVPLHMKGQKYHVEITTLFHCYQS